MYAGVSVTSQHGAISAEVIVDGTSAPMFMRRDGKRFVVGRPELPYMLRVTNLLDIRIEVITTVDGRHVLDDESGDMYRNSGFVIPARGSYVFRGWRKNDMESGQFVFCDPRSSVANWATGSQNNLGVIGFAVHRERRFEPFTYMSVAAAAPAAASGMRPRGDMERSAGLGTGMGDTLHDPVRRISFDRDGAAPDTLAIGYDIEEALQEMGILRPADPDPFPATNKTGYSRFQ